MNGYDFLAIIAIVIFFCFLASKFAKDRREKRVEWDYIWRCPHCVKHETNFYSASPSSLAKRAYKHVQEEHDEAAKKAFLYRATHDIEAIYNTKR